MELATLLVLFPSDQIFRFGLNADSEYLCHYMYLQTRLWLLVIGLLISAYTWMILTSVDPETWVLIILVVPLFSCKTYAPVCSSDYSYES